MKIVLLCGVVILSACSDERVPSGSSEDVEPVLVEGPQGELGPQGEQGLVGPQGPQGVQGAPGSQGLQGEQGLQGDVGLQGLQGLQGPQGPQGTQGAQGPQGDVGPQGPQGETGPIGPNGDTGTDGPQGLPGPQGNTGEQGPPGLDGQTGPQGSQGPQGVQGPMCEYVAGDGIYIEGNTINIDFGSGDGQVVTSAMLAEIQARIDSLETLIPSIAVVSVDIDDNSSTGTATCPDGSVVTGGGYSGLSSNGSTYVSMSGPNTENGWTVVLNSNKAFTVFAACMSLIRVPLP